MKFRHGLFSALPLIISGFVVAWCGFYLLFGANSIFALRTLEVQEAQLSNHLQAIQTERTSLEDRVVRMRPNSLDWDLVEQEARAQLGTSSKDTKSLNM